MASNGSGYTRVTHDIEGQNDERLEGLLGKVKILKDVSGMCTSIFLPFLNVTSSAGRG